ncbi:TasA family protein [uncultured Demequina sp.]|uniref:TasA family protein n=1 Tax=uncultured Demequina sp. TaxID=693499 RepID=UPI0025E586A2|nr:TasA family protein [uncultured Demequina sp.]
MASSIHSGRLNPVVRTRVRAPSARGLLATAVALVVGISGAVLAAGGSYAYLNATTPAGDAATITAGSAELLVSHGGGTPAQTVAIPATGLQSMLPGDRAQRQFVLHNTGVVPLDVSAFTLESTAWELRAASGACGGAALPGAPLDGVSTTIVPSLAAGATATVCLEVRLPAAAPAGSENSSGSFTITLDGIQVAP